MLRRAKALARRFSRDAKFRAAAANPDSLNSGARETYEVLAQRLGAVRESTPLPGSLAYYPYHSLAIVPRLLALLDGMGIDLRRELAGQTVLDVGTGDGDLAFFFEALGAARVIAVDYAPYNHNGLVGFRTLQGALDSRVELIDADVHELDFSSLPAFGVAFCFGFLYHSPNPVLVMQRLGRVAEKLYLTCKVFDSDESYAYFYDEAECNNDPTNWWCFSPKCLALILKRSGFAVEAMVRLDTWEGHSDPVDMSRDGRVFVVARSSAR